MLSRKYYKMIAKVIKDNTAEDKSGNGKRLLDKDNLINDLTMDFKADNGLFSIDRFINGCE